jgi:hypothetical protein
MVIGAGRRHVSLDLLCFFILWFPFDVPTTATKTQLCAEMDLCQAAKNEPRPVLFLRWKIVQLSLCGRRRKAFSWLGAPWASPVTPLIVFLRIAVGLFRAGGPAAGQRVPSVVRARGRGWLRM